MKDDTRAAMLEAALAYTARWDIFPAPPGTKKSYKAAAFSDGRKWGATKDQKEIKLNWQRWPQANIGIPTGRVNGFWVLDADTVAGHGVDGIAALRQLEAAHGALPATLMATSPSGSLHYYFKQPDNVTVKNSTNKLGAGVDVRGEGGMVLAPPSVKPGAGAYKWLNDLAIAAAPAWLVARVTYSEKQRREPNNEPTADENWVGIALAIIPNDDVDWESWNRIGMATWAATDGSDRGGALFDAWSQKSDKYSAKDTAAKWNAYRRSPPERIGAGTLFYEAEEACPDWRDALDEPAVAALIATFNKLLGDDWVAPESDTSGEQPASENDTNNKPSGDEGASDEQPAPEGGEQNKSGITAAPYDFPEEKEISCDDWLNGRHLLRGEVAGTAAMGGTGKSNLAIVEALAMASGRQLLHDTVHEVAPLRIVLINLEDKRNRMDKRIAAAMRHYGLTKADIGDRLIVLARGEIKIRIAGLSRRGVFERNEKTIKALTNLMIEKKADVLSIDSFIRTHGVNENDNSSIQEVVECFEEIATTANCAVHLWHHSRKMGGEKATVEAARGAMAFIDACRSVRILETMTRKECDELKPSVPDLKEPGWYFRAFNGKRNFAPPSDQSDWFQYVSVILNNAGNDFFDAEGDNIGVVTPWSYPRLVVPVITDGDIARALAAIKAGGPWRANSLSTKEPWVGIPIAKTLGLDLGDKRAKRHAAKVIDDWLKAGRLKRVKVPDRHGDQRDYIEVAA